MCVRTVRRVCNAAVFDGDVLNGVIGASTNGADGDSVASSASSSGEGDILDIISKVFPFQQTTK